MGTEELNRICIMATNTSPLVILDPRAGAIHIKGRCIPYDAIDFFQPILEWASRYVKNPRQLTVMEMHLEFINAYSAIQLKMFLQTICALHEKGHKIEVTWTYGSQDIHMPEIIENLLPTEASENIKVKIVPKYSNV